MNTRGRVWRIPQGQGAFAHARDLTAAALKTWDWAPERIEVVVLLVSELVTNAHRHAGTDAWLHLDPTPDGVTLTVRDGNPAQPAQRTPDVNSVTGGFGLHLLDHLAAGWGVDSYADGKRVWAQILGAPASVPT
ncbi:ATP-binding protein [Streptomyces sp. NPDC002889]|uniref:ATP-binding protein n=1 Tax=Streptomyces sp. NPDC002889 TaxID=3364669 RepID=UPI0036AEF10A